MAQAANQELVDQFEEFYRRYYSDEIGNLARQYPRESKSLELHWRDLYQMDPDLADDYISHPDQLQEAAEEALRVYDLPVDVSLGQAHVRVHGLAEHTDIRAIRAEHLNTMVSIQGMVRKATDVMPKIERAVFVCQRCGTDTEVPQGDAGFQEPYQCESCERQGPFKLDPDRSEFVDSQKLRIQESPEGLGGGETPQSIDVHVEDDATGNVTPGDHVTVTGVLRLDQSEEATDSPVFEHYMEGSSVVIEDAEFDELNISEADKEEIVALSDHEEIHEEMVDSMAPAIYGHREAKLAMMLQLFSGVTKHLPDKSRIRGDLHMLLIGDPGTGKCVRGDTTVALADGSEREIRDLVEANLDDPRPVDDGVWDDVDVAVPSLAADGRLVQRRATKVWKREAPETMYRVRTAAGHRLTVTPSHPLFVAGSHGPDRGTGGRTARRGRPGRRRLRAGRTRRGRHPGRTTSAGGGRRNRRVERHRIDYRSRTRRGVGVRPRSRGDPQLPHRRRGLAQLPDDLLRAEHRAPVGVHLREGVECGGVDRRGRSRRLR